ncbi:glycosyltransferase family 2 protein [Paludibacterium yongneupense]|uniref:glycosyltransferase family 2 protein n=1 Tax=Paludibacterium yongneupense TaxID=400061 RepID=UPI0003F8EDA7|nr:glycosyltransferase family 2 protein [Paludibacterium yongneupense]
MLTIGMPVYNEGKFIAAAITALQQQSYTDFRLIVSDNASSDDTATIAESFAAQDPRIQVVRQARNIGAFGNFQAVVDRVDTPYFMFAAGHDLWDPEFAAKCLAALEANPGAALAYPGALWFNNQMQLTRRIPGCFDTRGMAALSRLQVTMWGLVFAYQFYGIYRTQILKGLDLSKVTIGRDHIILCEAALRGEFVYVPEDLLFLRQGDDFNDADAYLSKISPDEDRAEKRELAIAKYCKQILEYIQSIELFFEPSLERELAVASVLHCCLLRYSNTLGMHGETLEVMRALPAFDRYFEALPALNQTLHATLDAHAAGEPRAD